MTGLNKRGKKVCIITFLSDNYGTVLQAYAIRKAVERLGYSVILPFISRNQKRPKDIIYIFQTLRHLTPSLLLHRNAIKRYSREKHLKFESFISQFVQTSTHKIYTPSELVRLGYDCIATICGSDMIWSYESNPYHNIFLLNWVETGGKIAYAPSIGGIENIPLEYQSVYKSSIKTFNAISCREKSGCRFIEDLTGRSCRLVCDPTLLFTSEEWNKSFHLAENRIIKEPYILVNCFGGLSPKERRKLEIFAKDNRFEIVYLNSGISEYLQEMHRLSDGYGPIEFLNLASNASYHIVNGYHGLLFSLIFKAPFALIRRRENDHWNIHTSRMVDLLEELDLKERIVSFQEALTTKFLQIDYTKASRIIQELRRQSWDYLTNSIEAERYE